VTDIPEDVSPLTDKAVARVSHPKESAHWYDLKNHLQVLEVPRAKGKGMRPATLRDAREHGYGYGVTTITGSAHRQQLVTWMRRQSIKATVDYLRAAMADGKMIDNLCAGLSRAVSLGKSAQPEWLDHLAAVEALADAPRDTAADTGTDIHSAVQAAIEGRSVDACYRDHVAGILAILPKGQTWLAEQCVTHSSGFGTKVDLMSFDWLLDFKSKDGDQAAMDAMPLYDDHHMQLAAGDNAAAQMRGEIRDPNDRRGCAIVFISRTHPGACSLRVASNQDLEQGWEMFQALLAYRKAKDNYYPYGTEPVPEF